MNTDDDRELIDRVSAGLDEQVQAQGEEIHQRLAAARRAAITEMERPVPHALSPWIPTVAVATTVLTVGLLSLQPRVPELPVYSAEPTSWPPRIWNCCLRWSSWPG